jgi:hypothetical protein
MVEKLSASFKKLGGWRHLVAALGLALALVAWALAFLGALGFLGVPPRPAYWVGAFGASVFSGVGSLAIWRQPDPRDESGLPI